MSILIPKRTEKTSKFKIMESIMLLCLLFVTSCSDNELEPTITTVEKVAFTAESGLQQTISITSSDAWKAVSSESWLLVSPSQGEAGTAELTLTADDNMTGENRTATITLTSGKTIKDITVSQDAKDFVQVTESYDVGIEGGNLVIPFTTNVDKIMVDWNEDWIDLTNETAQESRALRTLELKLTVAQNTEKSPRSATIIFYKYIEGQDPVLINSITINQAGNAETSTDYSADGKVVMIQKATIDKGIPIVIAGDGFIDKEIADGTYDKMMRQAAENLFTEEPIKSFRDYFDIYVVTAVSKNNGFGGTNQTVFQCQFVGADGASITGDDEMCMNYAEKANVDMANTLMVVVLNTAQYAGSCNFGYLDSNNDYVEFAIAYCPIIHNGKDELFKQVLNHEAVGHGLAKLEDEYAYEDYGIIQQEQISFMKNLQSMGWVQNVDFTYDKGKVLWSRFLSDSRYDWENLGVIEGACTYWSGAYRPSEESIMRYNTHGFNAPSREAIYKHIMKTAFPEWSYDYEDFVKFDLEHIDKSIITSRSFAPARKPFAKPRFVNKKIGIIG